VGFQIVINNCPAVDEFAERCLPGSTPHEEEVTPQLPRPRPQQASAPLPAPVAAPVRFGSIPPARCTTAPATGVTARPNTAITCPRQRRRRKVPGRTTEKRAPRRPIEGSVRPLALKSTSIGLARHRTPLSATSGAGRTSTGRTTGAVGMALRFTRARHKARTSLRGLARSRRPSGCFLVRTWRGTSPCRQAPERLIGSVWTRMVLITLARSSAPLLAPLRTAASHRRAGSIRPQRQQWHGGLRRSLQAMHRG
jgi:hypothetical protein